MFTNTKRVCIILVISVCLNFTLFTAAYLLRLPLWLDTTGTIYVSALLGFPTGFIAAIINNVVQALFFYGSDSLFFYFVSALTAFISGQVFARMKGKRIKRWLTLILCLVIFDTIAAVLITFGVNHGIPSDYWGTYLYHYFIGSGIPSAGATILAVSTIKIPDVILSVFLVMLAYRLTPDKIRNEKTAIV